MLREVRPSEGHNTSLVQKVYWILSKVLFYLSWDPDYQNQGDELTNSKKIVYSNQGYF